MALLLLCGCSGQMSDQPRYEPYEASAFWGDRRSARPAVAGTVARGRLDADLLLHRGLEGGRPAQRFPYPVTREQLERGRDRYGAFCAPCHGKAGYGDGMVVLRGFPRPPSFHGPELRAAPPGRLVRAMTEGYGLMDSYANRADADERWAIAAYIRALQLSQDARLADLPAAERRRLEALP